jgi:amino acid adenylation domain-containing protein
MTYAALERAAEGLAERLRGFSAGPDTIVALCTDRSTALAAGALGILKAGAAYLPLDAGYPAERIEFMLRDAGVRVVVASALTARRVPPGPWRVLDIDSETSPAEPQAGRGRREPKPADMAYAIYTSGSTGRPKGVPISHPNLLNLVQWHIDAFGVTADDRASHMGGLGFDAAVWELWPYLACGASVHMTPEEVRLDPERLRDWLVAQRITIAFAPTPIAERLIALPWPRETALRYVLTGADTLHRRPPAGLPFTLINNYGPTECTVVATSGVVKPDDGTRGVPSIGKAIDNVRVYILDEALRPVPDGEAGEICIGGAGVSRGYLNQPDLTARSFVPDPLDPNARMYRTGDVGRRWPNGEITFHGRMDDQIKVGAFRIEPAEITAVLNAHPGVRESAVVAREGANGKEMVAYVVPRQGEAVTSEALQAKVREQLPDYMVPRVFVRMDALPLNASGKLDRQALPAPGPENTMRGAAGGAAHNEIEKRLAKIVAGLLQLKQVGVEENFFMLGGNSLLGAQMLAAVREAFGVQMPLRTLFGAPTVARLALEVERISGKANA